MQLKIACLECTYILAVLLMFFGVEYAHANSLTIVLTYLYSIRCTNNEFEMRLID